MVLLGILYFVSFPVQAYHLPKWELGVGISALRIPAYRGAEGADNYLLPFPYVVYRGDRLRVDEEGMRGSIFKSPRLRLDFSLAGNLPVPDEGVKARTDMPALDPLGEIGPSLDVSLWNSNAGVHQDSIELWLRLPVRAAFSVGDPLLATRGWVFSPTLNAIYRQPAEDYVLRWNLSLGPLFATEPYHDYFYGVPVQYATATRTEYDAESGYSGSRISLGISMNRQHWYLGAFLRYDDLRGAVFEDSPLVETKSYFALAVVVSRVLAVSSENVAH